MRNILLFFFFTGGIDMREAFVKGVGFTLGIFVGMTIVNMIVGPINAASESKDKEESQ